MAKQMEAHLQDESKLWSFLVLFQKPNQECKEEKQREESNKKKSKRTETVGHISTTFWSPFYAYYISFRSLGSQESNALNGAQIRAEMKKLWPLEDNRTKLKGNIASCEITKCRLRNHKVQAAKSAFSYEIDTFSLRNFRSHVASCKIHLSAPKYL